MLVGGEALDPLLVGGRLWSLSIGAPHVAHAD
jgi:hypothetical protein